MNPLLEQFLSEARDFLQGIGEKLMQLEDAPEDKGLVNELFRLVHTLKGNSGLFDFPEMTRVLHAGEDLMDAVRTGQVAFGRDLADRLLDAMDLVASLCDEIAVEGRLGAAQTGDSVRLAQGLRACIPGAGPAGDSQAGRPGSGLGQESQAGRPGSGLAQEPQAGRPGSGLAQEPQAGRPGSGSAEEPGAGRPLVAPAPAAWLGRIPEPARLEAYRGGDELWLVLYAPVEGCFYQGEDPFFLARQTPGLLWGGLAAREPWPSLTDLDAYRSVLDFQVLSSAPQVELADHYRYVMDQVRLVELAPLALVLPQGDPNGGPVYEDFVADALGYLAAGQLQALGKAARALLELSNPDLWLASALRWLLAVLDQEPENQAALRALIESLRSLQPPVWEALAAQAPPVPAEASASLDEPALASALGILQVQRTILALADDAPWQRGRIQAAAATLAACLKALGRGGALAGLDAALQAALEANHGAAILAWLDGLAAAPVQGGAGALQAGAAALQGGSAPIPTGSAANPTGAPALQTGVAALQGGSAALPTGSAPVPLDAAPVQPGALGPKREEALPAAPEGELKFGRRAEDSSGGPRSLKVDQAKIDRLMNLIGEMVVSKNALPYLAGRAESVYGSRELSREIKAKYDVINRIAEEMQDAIMQVCMMPVSFVFQRFHRLVRDTSRKLGKEVNLVLEGEDTEADKNIIEALGDPLIHILRNSLDHGLELPEVRRAAGKPAAGTLTIRASQESDRVLIEIQDDGKGIDPLVIKRKAYETGVIDEATLARISDQEAVNLVFAPGLSTAAAVSDLSGRGVGMDVVRAAVEKVNGSIHLESELGKGTRIRLSLPLSMAVTKVMIVESDGQTFGVPMDCVIETVRVPRARIRTIKQAQATVLRGRIVALKSLNALLGLAIPPKANADGELAVLVVRLGEEPVGILVDQFHETVDVILKPMTGVLAGIAAYAGSALMGDGSVLMILNIKEVL